MLLKNVQRIVAYRKINNKLSDYFMRWTMDKKELGRRVNIARKDRGLTSEKLSELCHINATYLRQIEAG